jgi:hypothetical protein
MATLLPNLSITLSQRRWACVLDPSLVLSQYGVLLVQSLGAALDLWVARELWHILDNPGFYCQQPDLVVSQTKPGQPPGREPIAQQIAQQKRMQVLKNWELVRAETSPTHLNLFWIGDRPAESFLPDGTHPQLIERWEVLAKLLEERSQQPFSIHDTLVSAFRDTAALAAVLGSAFILTYQPSGETANEPPEICQMLEQWDIPCRQIDSRDAIAVLEREHLLQLVIATGLSKFLWAGLHLVVLHLVVPSAFTSYCNTQYPWTPHSFSQESNPETSPHTTNVWEGAQGFWYRL